MIKRIKPSTLFRFSQQKLVYDSCAFRVAKKDRKVLVRVFLIELEDATQSCFRNNRLEIDWLMLECD